MNFEDVMDRQAYEDGLVAGRADMPDAYAQYKIGTVPYYSWLAGFFDGGSEVKSGSDWIAAKLSMTARYYKEAVISLKQEEAQ